MSFMNQNNQYGFAPNNQGRQTYQQQPMQQQNQMGWQNWQNPQQPVVPPLNGRIIQNPNDVVPNDVRMDGSCSFFPVQDGSEIYVMRWSQDGSRIERMRYIPENANVNPESKPFEQLVMERLDSLEAMIRNQNKNQYHNGKKQFKKEESLNERVDTENNGTNGSK